MGLDTTAPDVRAVALTALIDFAGLFPPARLNMSAAVAGYRAARGGAQSWMVDRFICPVSRLAELAGALAGPTTEGEDPWRVAATADGGPDAAGTDARLVEAFEAQMGGLARVEVVETPLPASNASVWVAGAADLYRRPVYFEVPWRDGAVTALDSIASARPTREVGVKLRCGGVVIEAFPPPGVIAMVIAESRARNLPLKATAGLHHPFRHLDPATGFTHHGFVNLLVACTAASAGADVATLTEIIADTDHSGFTFDRGELGWREHRFDAGVVGDTREKLFVGYGSCSVDEPVDYLITLGVLPVSP